MNFHRSPHTHWKRIMASFNCVPRLAVVILFFGCLTQVWAEPVAQTLPGKFIWRGTAEPNAGYTVFRKTFFAPDVSAATLNLFADARYVLWINGQYVQRGPCRFDPAGPEYDSLDVKPLSSAQGNRHRPCRDAGAGSRHGAGGTN
jgi:hypothetical protein